MEEQLRKLIKEFDIRETGNKFLDEQFKETILDVLMEFIEQEIEKAREEEDKKFIEIFSNLKKEDLVNRGFILAIIKEELSKLTTK